MPAAVDQGMTAAGTSPTTWRVTTTATSNGWRQHATRLTRSITRSGRITAAALWQDGLSTPSSSPRRERSPRVTAEKQVADVPGARVRERSARRCAGTSTRGWAGSRRRGSGSEAAICPSGSSSWGSSPHPGSCRRACSRCSGRRRRGSGSRTTTAAPDFWGYLQSWDVQWYRRVAFEGYPLELPIDANGDVKQNTWAFFPVFPAIGARADGGHGRRLLRRRDGGGDGVRAAGDARPAPAARAALRSQPGVLGRDVLRVRTDVVDAAARLRRERLPLLPVLRDRGDGVAAVPDHDPVRAGGVVHASGRARAGGGARAAGDLPPGAPAADPLARVADGRARDLADHGGGAVLAGADRAAHRRPVRATSTPSSAGGGSTSGA